MIKPLSLIVAALLLGACSERHGESHSHDEHGHDEHGTQEHGKDSTRIDAAAAEASGVKIAQAGPAKVREVLSLHGTVVPDPQRVFRMHPRYPGIVKEIRVEIGDRVAKDDVLALIESSESLQVYSLRAPAAGVVVTRDANPGTAVDHDPILTVMDLSQVWVELAAFQHDLQRIRSGQPVTIRDVDAHQSAAGRVSTIAAVGSAASQSMSVRVVLPNSQQHWRPGLFVTGEILLAEVEVPLAVRRSAVQRMREQDVVFEHTGDRYIARVVKLGRGDSDWVEIASGLAQGTSYVAGNSYLIKADIEKSGAAHEH